MTYFDKVLRNVGWLCVAVGVSFAALDVVRTWVHLDLAEKPGLGVSLLLIVTGLMAVKQAGR